MSYRPAEESSDRLLVVEDDAAQRVGLQQLLRSWGYTVESAIDGHEALEKIAFDRPTIVLSDLVMPRLDGLGLLRALRAQDDTDITVVLMTAQGSVETAVEAIKQGAYDYVSKPIDPQRLKILLDQIVERHDTLREVRVLRRQLQEHGRFGRLIGASSEMRQIYQVIEQAAPTSTSVLVSGESGTGKELVAQTIHQLSPRAPQPFVPINCAAIPDTLLESELFGHEKGSFTGAIARRQGCFELANHGTLFLDEIAEMTPVTQVKLLRVLQERSFRTLGGQREQKVDVRVIAATNRDLPAMVSDGRFQEDLYYRLNVIPIHIPPLRERREDIPVLVEHFVSKHAQRAGKRITGLAPGVLESLQAAEWPGNVRELENTVERAVVLSPTAVVGSESIRLVGVSSAGATGLPSLILRQNVDWVERETVRRALEASGGVKKDAAELMGISQRALSYYLAKHRVE